MNSEHDRHDPALVARYAAGDAYSSEVDQARSLVAECSECAALAADITLISARLADLPPVSRSRDFRISPEQAQKLTGSWLDRVLRNIAAPRWTAARPLAGAVLAIGILVAAIGAVPLNGFVAGTASEFAAPAPASTALSGGAGTATTDKPASADGLSATPRDVNVDSNSTQTPQFAASSGAPGGVEVNTATPGTITSAPQESDSTAPPPPPKAVTTPAPEATRVAVAAQTPMPPTKQPLSVVSGRATTDVVRESSVDRSVLIMGGLAVAFIGLIAFAIMWLARRRYEDPLLR